MSDYEPVDLSALCNATARVLQGVDVKTGLQEMRGLPFQVGSGNGISGPCFVLTGGAEGRVTIPINKKRTPPPCPSAGVFAFHHGEHREHRGRRASQGLFKLARRGRPTCLPKSGTARRNEEGEHAGSPLRGVCLTLKRPC